ncbi:AAA family ATPase [Roseovarius sp. SK2]|uniref:AAA family ATPase n=1 Tax=Roseovarius TaxID=74030 RepID=UPI00237B5EFF|nr:AAA family ATPase [Roseovarius sp. SK2]MDD9727211.1 AAA family ATPase [Roseovarius sp. SK2]
MLLDFNNAAPQTAEGTETPGWAKNSYTREDVLNSIMPRLESVLGYLYPNGFADPKGRAFYIGNASGDAGQSLNIVLNGDRAGLWHDFATGDGGDIFDLWKSARGFTNFADTLQDMGDYSGAAGNAPRRAPKRKAPDGGEGWGAPVATYNYTDAKGSIIAQVDRFEWLDGTKQRKAFRPWDATRRKYEAPEPRPLYNLPQVVREPEIVLVEGEKCADALNAAGICATTAMNGSNAPVEQTDWTALSGRKVLIWPDNDETGHKYAEAARQAVSYAGAHAVSVLRIPADKPEKWDAADAAQEGADLRGLINTMRGETAQAERDGLPAVAPFRSWEEMEEESIPARDFLYGNHYIRKFASVTVAPGGLGKSTLVLVECIAMATGRDLLGTRPNNLCKVIYFNAEDPLDEIQRRILAVCSFFNIPQRELVGQLFIASGRDQELILSRGDIGEINEPVFGLIERYCEAEAIDVVAFDPLANMTDAPETNDAFRRLGRRLSRLADAMNVSVELVHHTRKLNGGEASVEDSRGGSALIGAVRAGRALNPMTPDEAAKAGLDTHIDHFRIEAAGKNNLSRSAPHATWFKRLGVQLRNGDNVAVIEPWQWPDAFDGISAEQAAACQAAVIGCVKPPRAHHQAKNWIGYLLAETLRIDVESKSGRTRINTIIKRWIAEDVLRLDHEKDPRTGRDVPVVMAGDNDLREVS